MTENKKNILPEQRQELLQTLKARFEKNMNRHKDLEWTKVLAKLENKTEKLGSLNEMERTGGEPDVVGYDKRRANTFFMIVLQKVPKIAEVFVMIAKRWNQGKNINRKIALLT